jgi:hypothetical protein
MSAHTPPLLLLTLLLIVCLLTLFFWNPVLQVKAAAAQAQAQAQGAVNMSAAAVKQVVDTALGTWGKYDK